MRIELKILLGLTACVAALAMVYGQETPSRSLEKAQSPATPALQPQATNVTTKSDFPIIGYIEKRGKTITIKAGPDLQEFFKNAVADNGGSLDARVRVRPVVDASLGSR